MTTVSIDNFDEVRLALRKELGGLAKKLENSLRSTDNDPLKVNTIRELLGLIKLVSQMFETITFAPKLVYNHQYNIPDIVVPDIKVPDITIPEIKVPQVNVPAPIVNVQPSDVHMNWDEMRKAIEPLNDLIDNIRSMSAVIESMPKHQDTFLENLAKESNRNLSNLSAVFSGGQSGMSIDEYKEGLKSSANVTSVDDTNTSTTLLSQNNNRKGFIIFNNSTAILYVKLGATASTSSFTYRLTPYGTVSETNFRYTGIIDGIWASDASGNAQITELT